MDILLKIIQVILSLSLLVLVHEFGHYITARIFKIRVEKFYLFFPPAIFKFKPRKSDTEFGIGCIPLGGFCKISGMIDESMDKESMAKPPQPWEFRSKPAWQRLIVLAGGVLMNVVLAIVLYIAILYSWGEQYIRTDDAVYGIEVNDLAAEVGFMDGDRIIAFDGHPAPDNFYDLQIDLLRDQVEEVTVIRNGDTAKIQIDPVYTPAMLNTPGMFNLRLPILVGSVPDSSLNAGADLRQGDRFLAVGDTPVTFYRELQNALTAHAGGMTDILLLRGVDTVSVPIKVSADGKMGVLLQRDISELNITRKEYSLLEAVPAGFKLTFSTIGNYVQELGLIFSPETEAYKSVGSFITIGSIFPSSWNWQIFWNITALLSVMLAVMNLLPIPALDGGHILFTLYEMITGRKPSQRFMETAQMIGMFLLLMIMILAFGNDILRLIR
ncbi:MAG TPA: RIP metalloprotease RseP [Candidatus Coprenecus stercoravium]|uniref:Zinc metalloprotease n=1 Tax=Candidatus Coprenecus stercoravium TaxID=2840735 RepID=A0A9D2K8F7_9BACT|nr:RIP metalloprotease RseP [Candidatus Coprenecus stercoravium]